MVFGKFKIFVILQFRDFRGFFGGLCSNMLLLIGLWVRAGITSHQYLACLDAKSRDKSNYDNGPIVLSNMPTMRW